MTRERLVLIAGIVALPLFLMGLSLDRTTGKLDVKVGETYYVCACGEGCGCETISAKPGKCSCDQDLVEAKVSKVEEGRAFFKAEGWTEERRLETVGKYICACGEGCNCNTISQKAGKCGCGADLKKVGS